jgi:hypothetical protein
MTGTTHALVGAAVGALIRHPGGAFLGGMASHALLDSLPHKDYERSVGLPFDVLGLLTVLTLSLCSKRPELTAGALGGLSPDIENIVGNGQSDTRKIFPSHWFRHEDRATRAAVPTEALVGAVALIILRTVMSRPLDGTGRSFTGEASPSQCVTR